MHISDDGYVGELICWHTSGNPSRILTAICEAFDISMCEWDFYEVGPELRTIAEFENVIGRFQDAVKAVKRSLRSGSLDIGDPILLADAPRGGKETYDA